jgi:serine/threonine-protein kinase HipA
MGKRALIYYRQHLAGYLSETDSGYRFDYDETYLASDHAKPVSVTLPLQSKAFQSTVLFSFFDGLIPEGWLLNVGKTYWKVKSNDRFELLITLCRDTIGAVSVLLEEGPENG